MAASYGRSESRIDFGRVIADELTRDVEGLAGSLLPGVARIGRAGDLGERVRRARMAKRMPRVKIYG